MHVFTGCDTVSAFAGKTKALKMVIYSKDYKDTPMKLGREWGIYH